MGLDIAILADDGRAVRVVALNPDDHHELMNLVNLDIGNSLSKIEDYYCDTEFTGIEIETFIADLVRLRNRVRRRELGLQIDALISLAEQAGSEGRKLHVLAD